jgi:phospholipase/lecithinase/hemolysin
MDNAPKQASSLPLLLRSHARWARFEMMASQGGSKFDSVFTLSRHPAKLATVKNLVRFAVSALLCELLVFPTKAAFTSFYIFGDGVCTTTNNTTGKTNYWGKRFTNGRVWIEVLAQRQGLTNNSITNVNWSNSSNNWSYFSINNGVNYQSSSNLVQTLNNFHQPSDAGTALFAVWVCDADFVDDVNSFGLPNNASHGTNITSWTNAINQSLTNHWKIITNLYYTKGTRTLIMPNAVDITEIPEYNQSPSAYKSFVRQRVIDFNTAFATTLNQARTSLPGITIYEPDIFRLLDNVLTNAANYGLTNALSNGRSIDVLEDPAVTDYSLNGPGTNYIFWDYDDPTAKFHEVMADVVQQLISPVQISNITSLNGSNRLDMANIPIGLNGFVDGSTNLTLTNWTSVTNITSTNATQTTFVPASGPLQFYRLRFPYAWSWP